MLNCRDGTFGEITLSAACEVTLKLISVSDDSTRNSGRTHAVTPSSRPRSVASPKLPKVSSAKTGLPVASFDIAAYRFAGNEAFNAPVSAAAACADNAAGG